MTPVETAQFRIRSLVWWGGSLALAGLGFRWIVLRTVTSGSSDPAEAATVALLGTLVALVGLGLLGVGLVAVGTRLGLTAQGIVPDPGAGPADPSTS